MKLKNTLDTICLAKTILLFVVFSYIRVYSLTENCATMESMSITVNTVGPTISTYGPGAFLRIMLARLESELIQIHIM